MSDSRIQVPAEGRKITMGADGRLQVPDRPILPYIEGDGIGADITRAARELGFVPKTGLEAGLEDLLGWAAGERAQDAFEKAHNELIQKGLA